MYGVIPIRFIGRAIFNIVMERKRWGVDLFTAPPKSITSAFVCDISRVCCHCHMASQGSLDWFRTETVITDCNCSLSAVPTRALVLILSRTLPVTEVRLKQLTSHGGDQTEPFRMIFSRVLLGKRRVTEVSWCFTSFSFELVCDSFFMCI